MNYQFSISQTGIKKTLADMFTNEMTFLTELCQNSQRAGASKIDINYSEETKSLTLIDDGAGFSDDGWESFFTVGSSSWDDTVAKAQNPFGIGCASCLYVADHISITSNEYKVEFNTDNLLSGESVNRIRNDNSYIGTKIRLDLKPDINIDRILNNIDSVFSAFTIPLCVNGKDITRNLALDSQREFHETDLGLITLVKHNATISQRESAVRGMQFGYILQGFKLKDSARHPDAWIHLASNKFRVRVPDRDCLIGDVPEIDKQVKFALLSIYKKQLHNLFNKIGVDNFVYKHWFEAIKYAPELLSDAPIPTYLFTTPEDIPFQENDYSNVSHLIFNSKEKLIWPSDYNNEYFFESVSISGVASDEDPSFLIGNYVYIAGKKYIETSFLPPNHWIKSHIIKSDYIYDDIAKSICFFGDVLEFQVNTAGFFGQKIILCDSYELTISNLLNLNDDSVKACKSISKTDAIWFDNAIIIPSGCSDLRSVCRQTVYLNKSEWDFEVDEDFLDRVTSELFAVIQVKRGGNISELLRDFIQEHSSELNVLADTLIGNTFHLTFHKESESSTVQALFTPSMSQPLPSP